MTIDIGTLLCLLVIGGIVLVIYLIIAAYNLVKTLKQSQKVLTDLEVVSRISSERAQQLDKLIEQASKKFKSSQGVLNSLPIIFKAIANIAKVVNQGRKDAESGRKGA